MPINLINSYYFIYISYCHFFPTLVMVRLRFDYCAAHSIPIKEKLRQGVVSLQEHNGLWNEVIIAQNHAEKVSTKTTSTENTKLWASFPPPPTENRTLKCSVSQNSLWLESSPSQRVSPAFDHGFNILWNQPLCFTRLNLFSQGRQLISVDVQHSSSHCEWCLMCLYTPELCNCNLSRKTHQRFEEDVIAAQQSCSPRGQQRHCINEQIVFSCVQGSLN